MSNILNVMILVIALHMEKTQRKCVYKPWDGSTAAPHLKGCHQEETWGASSILCPSFEQDKA